MDPAEINYLYQNLIVNANKQEIIEENKTITEDELDVIEQELVAEKEKMSLTELERYKTEGMSLIRKGRAATLILAGG
jgi:hypothetical protein